jgi:hypothetical protein
MHFLDIYQKINEEVSFMQRYIDLGTWTENKSEFFDPPHKATLSPHKTTFGQLFPAFNQSKSGVYVFVCNEVSQIGSISDFNSGESLSKLRMTDDNSAIIGKGQLLYVGECCNFSNRLSAHLSENNNSSTGGLHLYSPNRITIKPEHFNLIVFPLKETFYPQDIDSELKQMLREAIEIKLRAIYFPWIGK